MSTTTGMNTVTAKIVSNTNVSISDEATKFCIALNCHESGLSCCLPIFRQKNTPPYVCCDPDRQQIPIVAVCSSIMALLFILVVYFGIRYKMQRKSQREAEQAARNPPPYSIALTMELKSEPVLPPNYYDVINGKLHLTTEKDETPPPPFEDV